MLTWHQLESLASAKKQLPLLLRRCFALSLSRNAALSLSLNATLYGERPYPAALRDREKAKAKLFESFIVMTVTESDPDLIQLNISNAFVWKQDALTDLTGQQEELNIEGVETCYAHKVHVIYVNLFHP